jgi:hypothetical protein
MTGRDEAFRHGQRAVAKVERDFQADIARVRDSPDEILELVNFAVGVGQVADEDERLALRFILPTGRQVIAKMTHETAISLAASIKQTVELTAGIDLGDLGANGSG